MYELEPDQYKFRMHNFQSRYSQFCERLVGHINKKVQYPIFQDLFHDKLVCIGSGDVGNDRACIAQVHTSAHVQTYS